LNLKKRKRKSNGTKKLIQIFFDLGSIKNGKQNFLKKKDMSYRYIHSKI